MGRFFHLFEPSVGGFFTCSSHQWVGFFTLSYQWVFFHLFEPSVGRFFHLSYHISY